MTIAALGDARDSTQSMPDRFSSYAALLQGECASVCLCSAVFMRFLLDEGRRIDFGLSGGAPRVTASFDCSVLYVLFF